MADGKNVFLKKLRLKVKAGKQRALFDMPHCWLVLFSSNNQYVTLREKCPNMDQ